MTVCDELCQSIYTMIQFIPPLPTPNTCTNPQCKTCCILDPSVTFEHPITRRRYFFHHSRTCTYANLVYLLRCIHCPAFYVGETGRTLNERIINHRSSTSKSYVHLGIPSHAAYHGVAFDQCFRITIIKTFPENTSSSVRRKWERHYISQFLANQYPGINAR